MTTEAEWLEWRRGKATASKVAAAHTNSYGGMFKTVGIELGRIPEDDYTDAMARGHRWEQRLADIAASATGRYVIGEQALVVHPERPRYAATLDGLLSELPEATIAECCSLLEIKTKGAFVRTNWAYFEAQMQWQMLVSGVEQATLILGTVDDTDDTLQNVKIRVYEADEFEQSQLVDTAEEFLDYIDNDQMPHPDSWEALEYVKASQPPAVEGTEITLDPDLVDEYKSLKEAEENFGKERQLLEAQIRVTLGTATKGLASGFTISLSKNSNVVTDEAKARMMIEHPELTKAELTLDVAAAKAAGVYDLYREPIGSRRLTIKRKS